MTTLAIPQSFTSLAKINNITGAGLSETQAEIFFGGLGSSINVGANGASPQATIAQIQSALAAYPTANINWEFNSFGTNASGYPGLSDVLNPPAYNAGTSYTPGQTVVQAGVSYFCISNTTGNTPGPSTSAYWLPYDLNALGVTSISYDPESGLSNGTPVAEQDALQWQNYTYVIQAGELCAAEGLEFIFTPSTDVGMCNLSCYVSTAVPAGAFTSLAVTGLQNYVQGGDTISITWVGASGLQSINATVTGAALSFQGGAASRSTPVTINCTGTAPTGGIPIGALCQDTSSGATTVNGTVTGGTTTAIPVAASQQWWFPGDSVKLSGGGNTNTLTVASTAAPGATVVNVTSAPSHSYTTGHYLVNNQGQAGASNGNTYKYSAAVYQGRGAWAAIPGVDVYSIQSQQLQGTYGPNDPTFKGAWSSSFAYHQWDLVSYGGYYWLALQAGTNQTPSGQSAYWTQVASSTYFSFWLYASGMMNQAAAAAPGTQCRLGLGINPAAPATKTAWTDIWMAFLQGQLLGAVGYWHNVQNLQSRTVTAGTNGSSTILDGSVVENDGGSAASGSNLPANTYVGWGVHGPTPGVSWTAVNSSNTPVNATGSGTITITGVPYSVYATFFEKLYTYLQTGAVTAP